VMNLTTNNFIANFFTELTSLFTTYFNIMVYNYPYKNVHTLS